MKNTNQIEEKNRKMKSFKTESKKILELMINSIYTNKEIFLRELISNASDALDKLYFKSLTDTNSQIKKDDLKIKISVDKTARTLTISDGGIGMTKAELENNLGTIAKSGSQEFKQNVQKNDEISIIGQFGVGFYSAFMVADNVKVISKAYGQNEAFEWHSSGTEGYEILPSQKDDFGTDIILHIKPNTDDENYDKFLEEYEIEALIKKYSDFIKYPIMLLQTHAQKDKDGKEKFTQEFETVNAQKPLWKRDKKEIKPEEYENFYSSNFYDYNKPLKTLHFKMEGKIDFSALLFIPEKAPYDFYTKEYEKGLKLYTNGVLITDKCSELLSDSLSFVRGVVDADLPLNVSRETLQDSREVKLIAQMIENKVLDALKDMLATDRANYEKFFDSFGLQLKYCIYRSYGMEKDKLVDLLLYKSAKTKTMVTLKEYCDKKQPDQKKIFYATGESLEAIKILPQVDMAIASGFDVLALTDDFDEFAIKFVEKYQDMDIVNVTSEKFDEQEDSLDDVSREIVDFVKETLKDKVEDVKITSKLNNFPVAISTEGELSLGMEKVLNTQAIPQKAKAQKILKIKKDSAVFAKIKSYYATDKEKLKDIINLLFVEAQLVSGAKIDDVALFANTLNKVI